MNGIIPYHDTELQQWNYTFVEVGHYHPNPVGTLKIPLLYDFLLPVTHKRNHHYSLVPNKLNPIIYLKSNVQHFYNSPTKDSNPIMIRYDCNRAPPNVKNGASHTENLNSVKTIRKCTFIFSNSISFHLSIVTDLTNDRWTPSPRCFPEHSKQIQIP